MKIRKDFSEFDIFVIDDTFSENEYYDIWKELNLYFNKSVFLEPEKTGSATNEDGSLKKKNMAVFLDNLYTQDGRVLSSILKYSQKLLSKDVIQFLENKNPTNGIIKNCNFYTTLVNYYEDEDFYDYHFDVSAYSILSYVYKEPKSFIGGDLIFEVSGEKIKIDIKNNMSVIFPSIYNHKVTPIKLLKNSENDPNGRFSIAQFLYISLV